LPSAWSEARRRRRGQAAHLRYDDPSAFTAALASSGFAQSHLYWVPIAPGKFRGLQRHFETNAVRRMLAASPILAGRLSHSLLFHAQTGRAP
jgi:hypothetical protein